MSERVKKVLSGIGSYWFLISNVIVVVILIFLVYFRNSNYETWILLITYVGLVYYAEETKLLREQAQAQNDAQLRPFLVAGWDEGFDQKIYLKNMGEGIALHIHIEREPSPAIYGDWKYIYKFDSITSIRPSDPAGVTISYREDTKLAYDKNSVTIELMPPKLMSPVNKYRLIIRYQDIVGRRYKTIMESNILYNQKFKLISYETPSAYKP